MRSILILLLFFMAVVPADAQTIWTSIVSPKNGDLVIGEFDVVVDVISHATISEVEFRLDGQPIGTLAEEPFRLHVDLGETNIQHTFSVVARDVEGNEAFHSVSTHPVPIAADYEVDLRQLYVSVTRDDERVIDLNRDVFELSDEGDRQELVTFARGDIPFTAVLLIDASGSMIGEKIDSAVAGAAVFIHGMRKLDQAQVMVFSDQLLSSTPITGAKALLTAGLSGTEARGGTALFDHLFVALKLLEQRQGRRVLVLLSDGVDTHSVLPNEHVFEAARRSDVLTYWIRFVRDSNEPEAEDRLDLSSAWKNPDQYREQRGTMTEAVNQSGGRIFGVTSPSQIQPVFGHIMEELRSQYVLGYYPDNKRSDGNWHRVKVVVAAPGVEVRAPGGYVDH